MSELEIYTGSFFGKEEDIFKALRAVKFGELIPQDGVLNYFYDQVQEPSTTLFLKSKKRVKFFYVDNDDFITSIMEQVPNWVIDVDKNILRINLLFKSSTDVVPLVFNFDAAKPDYIDAVKLISKKEEFDLYFISILYGGLVVENRVKLKIPKSILKTFKSIK